MSLIFGALLLNVAAATSGPPPAAPVRFDRVDLVALDPGTWANYDTPQLRLVPMPVLVRWVEQVQTVVALPHDLSVGVSLASQSLAYDRPFAPGSRYGFTVGLHTKLLFPRGVFAAVTLRVRRLRVALGAIALTAGSWAYRSYRHWDVLPTIAIGVGRPFPGDVE